MPVLWLNPAQESLANVRWQSRAIAAGCVSRDQARVKVVFVEPSVQSLRHAIHAGQSVSNIMYLLVVIWQFQVHVHHSILYRIIS